MITQPKIYKSNGKLLLTGEYVVLDGAKALAIPTRFGQSLAIETNSNSIISWKSYDELNTIWFEDDFSINEILAPKTSSKTDAVSKRILQILNAAKQLNPNFLNTKQGYTIKTHLDFNRSWGLGTSSTLINNIAQWAKIDAYKLLKITFGGSGYDIACAQHNTPITYTLDTKDKAPIVKTEAFNPLFKGQLYFVYLNKKQNSRDGIANYRTHAKINTEVLASISSITNEMLVCKTLSKFQKRIEKHESIIGELIKQTPIKAELFPDFNGSIKSLGAWGGDFVLVASEINPTAYFTSKGFTTVMPYSKMVLS